MAEYWLEGETYSGVEPPPAPHCLFPYHFSYVCGWCGVQWFRRKVGIPFGRRIPWGVYCVDCSRCGSGSILRPFLTPVEVAAFPVELIRRELLLELDLYEKKNNAGLLSQEHTIPRTLIPPSQGLSLTQLEM